MLPSLAGEKSISKGKKKNHNFIHKHIYTDTHIRGGSPAAELGQAVGPVAPAHHGAYHEVCLAVNSSMAFVPISSTANVTRCWLGCLATGSIISPNLIYRVMFWLLPVVLWTLQGRRAWNFILWRQKIEFIKETKTVVISCKTLKFQLGSFC